jgi:predicted transcriptional regulator
MNLQEVIDNLGLRQFTNFSDLEKITPTCGYTSDLLSCVMAGAKKRSLWVTLQSHGNIVAVSSLLDLSAVIITEGAQPEEPIIQKANEEGVILLGTEKPTFQIVGLLWEMGFRCQEA